ncbi:MAG TPA: ABC transporter ATP-binding protein [Phycisphaerales bacterium]|nr:ABC transporter ATP-binding protein [Phycisphaerales bacterium]
MQIVTFVNVHKSFGQEIVFEGLSERLYAHQKVGMIGANGSGKTTFIKLILGEISPDVGEVVKRKGLRVGYLPQEPVFSGGLTVMEEMHAGVEDLLNIQRRIEAVSESLGALSGSELEEQMKEYDRLNHAFEVQGGYEYEARINTILAGLGFEPGVFHERTSSLSGGQLSRLGLAKVLLSETDLLLLDEPTNHLDLQAVEWLEKFLRNYKGAAVIISHDRYLLDRIATRIIEIGRGKSRVWKGNYSDYVAAKANDELRQRRRYKQRTEMVEKTRDFIARNINQKGMQGTARGRAKRLGRLFGNDPDYLDRVTNDKRVRFSFARATSGSDLVLRCEFLSKSFGETILFKNLSFDLLAGERLGITGPNGTGKSTFLKLALGHIRPTDGSIRMGTTLKAGYLDQCAETLDADKTVLEEAKGIRPDMTEEALRGRLGGFLFCGDDVLKRVGDLSGGQLNRLMLCKLVLAEPDVLVLDEPTNHLDIPGRETLEGALKRFNGTLIVVSHDRFFLDRVVGKLIVMGVDKLGAKKMGQHEMLEAPAKVYSRYAQILEERLADSVLADGKGKQKGAKKPRRGGAGDPKGKKTTPKELRRFNKLSVEEIEEAIMLLEEEIDGLQVGFGDEAIYKQPELLAELRDEIEEKQAELALLYRAYEIRN